MRHLKRVFIALIALCALSVAPSRAQAGGRIVSCGELEGPALGWMSEAEIEDASFDFAHAFGRENLFANAPRQRRLTCQELRGIRIGLEATSLSLGVLGMGTACTGAGVPLGVTLMGAGVVVHGMQMIVDAMSEQQCAGLTEDDVNRLTARKACEVLVANGFSCEPNRVRLN